MGDVKEAEEEKKVEEEEKEEKDKEEEKEESKEEEKKTLLQDQATVDVANAEAENIRATAKHNLRVAKTLGEMQEKQGLILSGVEAIKAEEKVAAVEAEEKSIEEKLPTRAPTMDKEEAEESSETGPTRAPTEDDDDD